MAKIIQSFLSYAWHDARLVSISIDRSEPGKRDSISFRLDWARTKKTIVFGEVYQVEFKLNFGVIIDSFGEPIYSAACYSSDDYLKRFYYNWNHYLDNIALYHFVIVLASTGSKIDIIAKDFVLK